MRKTGLFTHVRANSHGDVSGKRFSTHAMERNVAGNGKRVGVESDVRLRRVGAVGLRYRARQEFARGMHQHVALSRGYRHGIPSRGTATNLRHETTSQWHINKDTPDDFSSGVSEERQLPTLPPGLAVPSAMTGLASLFGMGRGGSPSL